jgi:Protein of unknown function
MDRDVAKDLYAACERTLAALTEAEQAIHRVPDEDERKHLLRAVATVVIEVLTSIRAPVVMQHPDLEPTEPLGRPDSELSEEDQALVSSLRASDLEAIDTALIAQCATSWRKVARVVGTTMGMLRNGLPGIPDGYYVQRVAILVHSGRLESQGNLEYMRFSEVRLPLAVRSAA